MGPVLFMLPSVRLKLNQKLMLSMELMVDMVLDTVLTLLDMVGMAWDTILMVLDMDTLPLVMVMAMDVDMASMDKQHVTSQRPNFQPLSTFQGVKNPCQ